MGAAVDEYAVAGQRRPGEPARFRHHSDTDEDGIDGDRPPVGEQQRLHGRAAAERTSRERFGEAGAQLNAHSFLAVQRGEPATQALPEHVSERDGRGFDQRHVDPDATRRGGDLLADEAGAHDGQPGARKERGPQGAGVGQRAQHVHVRASGEQRQPARAAAGGDDEIVVAELLTVLEPHTPPRHVEPRCAAPEQQLDALRRVPRRRPERGIAVARGEQLLGEGRAVVRRDRLRAHDPDGAVVATGAQRLGCALGGEPAADDEDALLHGGHGRHDAGKRRQRAVETSASPIRGAREPLGPAARG